MVIINSLNNIYYDVMCRNCGTRFLMTAGWLIHSKGQGKTEQTNPSKDFLEESQFR